MPELLGFAAIVALGFFASWTRKVLVRRKRRARAAGKSVSVSVRLRGDNPPYPRRPRWGSIRTGESPLLFRTWHRMRAPVPIVGLRYVSRELGALPNVDEGATVFRLRDAVDGFVELGVPMSVADLVEDELRAETPAAGPPLGTRRRRTWPAFVLLSTLAAVAWIAVWLYIAAAGSGVDAVVLHNDDAYCQVRWGDGAERQATWVDCDDELVGETLRVHRMPWPWEGNAADVAYTPWLVSGAALVLLLPLGWFAVARLVRRGRPEPPPTPQPALVGDLDPVEDRPLEGDALRYASVAATMERRAAAEAWHSSRGRPFAERWPRSPKARLAVRSLTGALWPLLPLLIAVGLGVETWLAALAYDDATWAHAQGRVVSTESYLPFFPDDVTVEFAVGADTTVEATMPTRYDHETGDSVVVRHDPDDPDLARLSPDGGATRRAVTLTLAGAGLALLLLAWRCAVVARRLLRYRRLTRSPATAWRYVLLRDVTGDLGLLLFEPFGDPLPSYTASLDAPAPPDLRVSGAADVRGEPRDGALLVADAGGHRFYLRNLVELDEELAADLVNRYVDFDDEDD